MIELYTWTTPNGRKPIILLEELGLPYEIKPVDLRSGEQKSPNYLRINPNGKIPALVDRDEVVTIFESGAILIYLAEKAKRFLPPSGQERASAMEWLMFQMSAIGPFMGQLSRVRREPTKDAGTLAYFTAEVERELGVLEARLGHVEYLAGTYGIADIANFTWVSLFSDLGFSKRDFPNVSAWLDRVGARPAVKKAMEWKV